MKKKIIIAIIVLLVVLAGVGIYLFQFTDFFKSDSQLFGKYILKNSEAYAMFNNDSIKNIRNKRNNNAYKQKSELRVKNGESNYKVTSETEAQNINNTFTRVKVENNQDEVLNFNLVKNNNMVGFRMNEITNGYVEVKNSNFSKLFENVNIENKEMLPDFVNSADYLDVLDISLDDMKYLTNKYSNFVMDKTNKKNYSKVKDEKLKINDRFHYVDEYKLNLTENEFKQLTSEFFMELSNDSRFLNALSSKLKLMNLPANKVSVNSLSEQFREYSNKINSLECTDNQYMEIIAYVENDKLLRTDIKLIDGNAIEISYDNQSNSLNIKQQQPGKSNKFVKAISEKMDKLLGTIHEVQIETNASEEHSEIITTAKITCENDVEISYNCTTRILSEVVSTSDYGSSMKLILNELEPNQLEYAYNYLYKKITDIYKQRIDPIIKEVEVSLKIN